MGYELANEIPLSFLLRETNSGLNYSNDILINNVAPFHKITSNSLSFSKDYEVFNFDCAVLINDLRNKDKRNYIASEKPRLDFIKLLNYLYDNIGFKNFDFPSQIHPSVVKGENVTIERGCNIEEGVILEHNVVIHTGTTIGKNSRVRANSSIGGDGFGFERLENEEPIRFPHLGGVIIGESVEIGSNTCIARGTLENTIIKNHVKIDNLVHIAHNCIIDEGAFIIACAEISGGVHVGKNAWVGPNASVIQKLSLGSNILVGLGAVVTKSIPDDSVYAGNPAKYIRKIK